ncbi:hypothetical protein L6452_18984 [Arctium lappa]|uniref:Uncharacterized protein n=1 Tax=Arctium lappa TaxID=4217 RepID=A0ACB9B6N7_ARCLA|nr:hypothetical protein L6452_18984 [Arctium lappa]
MSRVGRSGQQNDGMGVLTKLLKSEFAVESGPGHAVGPQVESCADHWMNVTVVSLYNCGLSVRVHGLVVVAGETDDPEGRIHHQFESFSWAAV